MRRLLFNSGILTILALLGAAASPAWGQSGVVLRNPVVIRENGQRAILRLSGATASSQSTNSPDVVHASGVGPSAAPQDSTQPDVYVQNFPGATLPVTVRLNFEGINAAGKSEPYPAPDPNGAAGATQYVEWVNAFFAVFNKQTGAKIYGPATGLSLFKGFAGPCGSQTAGDGIAQYDKAAARWIISYRVGASNTGPYDQCIAVSKTSDATQGWNLYSFQISASAFPDYPKLGVWPDAYYETANLLSPTNGNDFLGSLVCAFDRAAMLTGAPATAQCFTTSTAYESLLPSDVDGNNPPPSGSPDYLLNLDVNSLDLWEFHVDWVTPANSTLTGPTNLPVAKFTQACSGRPFGCIPQPGTTQALDGIGDRVMYRLAYRNFGDYESLVVTHSVNPPDEANAGIRWYEIRNPGSSPIIYQQGTFSPDGNSRWLGSAAMDQDGDIAIGYSISSSVTYPGMRFTGRLATDPLGTLENEVGVIPGHGAELSPDFRWGDYGSMAVDPTDDCTFWFTSEFLQTVGTNNWSSRVVAFKFNNCGGTNPAP